MAGSEAVFDIVQLGAQSGTAYSPGAAVAATIVWPVEAPVNFDLDRSSQFPVQDYGKNVRNHPGTGYHGLRASAVTLPGQVRFEDIMDILEMHHAGGVVPTGAGPYVWVYPFESGTPTLVPRTIEGGSTDAAEAQMRMVSCLVDQLTIGFPDIIAPGAYPWTLSASIIGMDRAINAVTGSLAGRTGLETVQGHLTVLSEGTTATAFASLATTGINLKSYTQTTNRNLARRAYGGSTDVPTRFGFKSQSGGTFEAKVGVSTNAKSDFHDIWTTAGGSLGERRWRVKATGSGTKYFQIDSRVAIFAVPYDEVDGERVFKVSGEFVDDSTLGAPQAITVSNSIATL